MGKKSKSMVISEVIRHNPASGMVGPVLPRFRHAPCDPHQLANTNVETDMEVTWTGNRPNIQLSLTTPHMTYKSCKEETKKYHNTFIAIRNKKTGKTRLIEASTTVMEPSVIAPKTTNPVLLQEVESEQTREDKMAAGRHLIKAFGQAKGQRFYEQQDRMKVENSQIEEKVGKAAELVSDERLEAAAPVEEMDIVPPCDRNATTKQDVYKLENLLNNNEVESLASAAETLLTNYNSKEKLQKCQQDRLLSPLGVDLLAKCLNHEEDISQLLATVLYMEAIIKFTNLRPGEFKKGTRALQSFIPIGVKNKIFDKFTTGPSKNRCLNPEVQDRAVCYILVLGLMATDYKLNLALLSESIRARTDKLKKLIAMVGAYVQADSITQQNNIILRLPLAKFDVNLFMKEKK